MDEKTLNDQTKRLQKINAIIAKLDPAIRAEAFSILKPYVIGHAGRDSHVTGNKEERGEQGTGDDDAEAFFSSHESKKPADNALLVVAFFYGKYGSEAFSLDEIQEIANDAGITIPERVDMTLRAAKRNGKALFRCLGKGQFKLTVNGEAFVKTTFNVKKGRQKRLSEDKT